jgi:hypothetical protein
MLTIEYNTMDRTKDYGTSIEEEVQQITFVVEPPLLSPLKKH